MVDLPEIARLEALVAPVVAAKRLELYDVEILSQRKQTVLRVTVERPGRKASEAGVTIDELVAVNHELSALLDEQDPIHCAYQLEVTSPGVERKLNRLRHYEGALGEQVHVVLRQLLDGESAIDGVLRSADAEQIVVASAKRGDWTIPLASIKSASTVYAWSKRPRARSREE